MAIEGMFESSVTGILKSLGSVVAQHISMAWGTTDAMKKLKDKLEMIQAVTDDAEQKQVTDRAVKLWLKWLKDVAYDADDVLDEFSYQVMRQNAKVQALVPSSSNPSALFLLKMSRKIKDVNKRLDEINSYMVRFNLEPTDHSFVDYDRDMEDRMTSSFIGDFEIVGRDNDKSLITKNLLMTKPSSSSYENQTPQEKIHVMSIVGMGGLGKTTLAQFVYNEESININFEAKAWVCISKKFDIFNILENILESITEKKSSGVSNVDVLVRQVHQHIAGKKYLIVLDDVWNENAEDWEKLMGLLRMGAQGSKILVTTRSDHVASIVRGTIPPYNLTALSDQYCWSIIKNKAFSPGGALETETMTRIGKEIATRCSGLPLAANFLGSLMRLKRKECDWLAIQNNGIFDTHENPNRIIQILKLSYDYLPTHLKQCFSYCCLFPKGWVFYRDNLIQLWIAEGFLHPSVGGRYQKSLEEIGNDHFRCLLSNSFFQDVKKDELGDVETFKMHDLVHDLALSVVGSHEAIVLNASEMESHASDIRRAQVVQDQEKSKASPSVLKNAEKLRTILYKEDGELLLGPISNKRLRVIFNLGSVCLEMPSTPFRFKHLRYLDLSSSTADNVHVASISQLYNLQVLNLRRCKNAHKILREIASLKNLRHLDFSVTNVEVLPDSILGLTNLQTLHMGGCGGLQALPVDIGSLQQLSTLDVSCTSITDLPDSVTTIYSLKKLKLNVCNRLETLPSNLGALTQLRALDVSSTSVKELPDSFTSNLCNLELVNLGNGCNFPKDIKNWVQLTSLVYSGETSQLLMSKGMESLTYLKTLIPFIVTKEEGTNKTCNVEELAALNSLQELDICNLENVRGGTEEARRANLNDFGDLRKLKLTWKRFYIADELIALNMFRSESRKLCADDNEQLRYRSQNDVLVLEGLQPHPNLGKLKISGFYSYKFPKWLMGSSLSSYLPNLVKLELEQGKKCKKLPALGMLPCLQHLRIAYFDFVKRLGDEFYYKQEETSREGDGDSEEETTPRLSLFPSLVFLQICGMESLKEWVAPPPYVYAISFPLLETVLISGCPLLQSIPYISNNSSGPTFNIDRCDKLYESKGLGFRYMYVHGVPTFF